MKWLSYSLAILLTLFHIYSSDLVQINRDKIFMSSADYDEHLKFLNKIPSNEPIIIAGQANSLKTITERYEDSANIISKVTFKQTYDEQALIPLIAKDNSEAIIVSPPKGLSEAESQELLNEIMDDAKVIDPKLSFAGVGYINHELDNSSRMIQKTLFPLTFFLCFIGLILILRNIKISLLIFLPSILVTGISLAFIKFFVGNLDMVTSIIPLMTYILNLTMGLHLALTRLETQSIREVLQKKMRPILLMVITTTIGFGSLLTSDIPVIRSFAWISALLILITHFIHVLMIYPIYDFLYPRNYQLPRFLIKVYHKIQIRSLSLRANAIVFTIAFSFSLWAGLNIPIHTQAAHYFNHDSKIVLGQEFIHSHFLGNPNFDIILNVDDYNYENVLKIEKTESEIKELTHDKIISAVSLTKEINRKYSGNNIIPSNSLAWATLDGQIPQDFKENLVKDQFYKMTLVGPLKDTDEYFSTVQKVKEVLEHGHFPYSIGGLYYTLMLSQKNLIKTLGLSFSLSLLIMVIIAYIFYPKIKILLIFCAVNLIPLSLSLILFKIFNLSFNVATIMTFSLSLGMVVDGTFHIIHAVQTKEPHEKMVKSTFLPILISSLVLSLCFLTFSYVDFLPIREFGIALSINILTGLYFDLVILPQALSKIEPRIQ